MTILIQSISVKSALSPKLLIWLVAVGGLSGLLALLTIVIMNDAAPTQDIRAMDWIVGWDLWGLTTFLAVVSIITGLKAGIVYGSLGLVFLLLLGRIRQAIVFTAICLTVGLVAVLGDFTLGELVDRGRPLASSDNPSPAFPSGHVFGATVFFGFMGFLAINYRMKPKLLVPLLAIFSVIILLVGPARVHVQSHFPSDAAAGYLLASIWLLVIIPIFAYVRGTKWMSGWRVAEDPAVAARESCRVASSIASVVVLNPVEGTAT